jgi:hypothetical protein
MVYGSRLNSIKEGDASERLFVDLMEKRGWEVSKANKEDQFKHIDFYVSKNGVWISVDVKSQKRASAFDSDLLEDWVWVEFAGHSGSKGWLYGEQTHIAFHTGDGFILVSRESLVSFCELRVDISSPTWEWASEAREAKYKLYRRWSANNGQSLEKSALINLSDLKSEITYKLV